MQSKAIVTMTGEEITDIIHKCVLINCGVSDAEVTYSPLKNELSDDCEYEFEIKKIGGK